MTAQPEPAATMAAFFTAVSFDERRPPAYERLPDLFHPGGVLVRLTDAEPAAVPVAAFAADRRQAYGS